MCQGRFVRLMTAILYDIQEKMTKNTIREIIDSYRKKDVPTEVKDTFERWLVDTDAFEEKDAALKEIWETIDGSEGLDVLKEPMDVIAEAERKSRAVVGTAPRRRNALLWFTSTVAACMTIIAAIQFFTAPQAEVCLASSSASKGEFRLPDGSKVWLNKDSRLYYAKGFDGRKRKVRLEGEGYFDVAKDKNRPFIVESQDMDIEVLGTRFTLSAYEDEPVTVYLAQGSVRACIEGCDDVLLKPDQALTYNPANRALNRYDVVASDHVAWIGGKLEFTDRSLYDILQSLEHWYCVDITCEDPEAAKTMHLSMTVRQEPLTEILEALELLASVSYTFDEEGDVRISL